MISYLGEWIKHLVLVILVATFLDLLLPNSQMRRYITLVVGLIIIVMILSPILQILKVDHERMIMGLDQLLAQEGEREITAAKQNAQKMAAFYDQAVLMEVERMWAREIKHKLEEKFPLRAEEVEVELSLEDQTPYVRKVNVYLSPKEAEQGEVSGAKTVIEPIQISVFAERRAQEGETFLLEKEWKEKVITYFDQEWNISDDKVEIYWTGG